MAFWYCEILEPYGGHTAYGNECSYNYSPYVSQLPKLIWLKSRAPTSGVAFSEVGFGKLFGNFHVLGPGFRVSFFETLKADDGNFYNEFNV